jgi:hypothetical protein
LATLIYSDLKPGEAGWKHAELHASRRCEPYRDTSHRPRWCWLEQKDHDDDLQQSNASSERSLSIADRVPTTQHIHSRWTRAEPERRVMKTIIKRHAIWNRLLAVAERQPGEMLTNRSLLSGKVTYGLLTGGARYAWRRLELWARNRERARSPV